MSVRHRHLTVLTTQNLLKGFGLLSTDQILALDANTKGYMNSMAEDQKVFFQHFVRAMVKLGETGVIRQERMVRSDKIVAFSTVKKSFVPHPAVFDCVP